MNQTNHPIHWNRKYSSKDVEYLGWFEEVPTPSLKLIEMCNLEFEDPILDVGAGTITLITSLIALGVRNI
jgi:hypothetical protein